MDDGDFSFACILTIEPDVDGVFCKVVISPCIVVILLVFVVIFPFISGR
jgi:hypothetical protein